MNRYSRMWTQISIALAAAALAGCGAMPYQAQSEATLAGTNEVPPVATNASGRASISVAPDRSVAGTVTTSGIAGTMAHIHMGASNANGPVIVPLTKSGDNIWSVPAGAKLTEVQYRGYSAGNLYVNVHSAAHPGGEIRAQLLAPPPYEAPQSKDVGGY